MSSSYISEELRERVRQQAGNRCGYCLSPQKYVLGCLEIEHIYPVAHGGTDEEENLWLSCRLCNGYKGAQVSARDPVTSRLVRLMNYSPPQAEWGVSPSGNVGHF
jgi:5-methylcytosine-specific restriction endonuclease McrA